MSSAVQNQPCWLLRIFPSVALTMMIVTVIAIITTMEVKREVTITEGTLTTKAIASYQSI